MTKYIPENELQKIVLQFPTEEWNWFSLSENPNISIKMILCNKLLSWNWVGVSRNINITSKIILNNPDIQWNMYCIYKNPNISLYDIKILQDKFYTNWNGISSNPNLDTNFIL